MKRICLLLLFMCPFIYGQEFANIGFEDTTCVNDCDPQNGQMSCVDGWWEYYVSGIVPLKNVNCEPELVCNEDNSILLVSTSGSPGSMIRTNNPFFGADPAQTYTIKLTANRSSNGHPTGVVRVIGNHPNDFSWNPLGHAGPANDDTCEEIIIVLDSDVTTYEELSFAACTETGTCHGGVGNYIVVDDIRVGGPLVDLDESCGDLRVFIDPAFNEEVIYFEVNIFDTNGTLVTSDFNEDGSPLNFTLTQTGTYTFQTLFYTANADLFESTFEHTITSLSAEPVTITANNEDITNTLTYMIPCGETCVTINATNITDAVYNTTDPVLTDEMGLFCLQPGSTLTSFTANITGTDSCGNPYSENVTVTVEQDCCDESDTECFDFNCEEHTALFGNACDAQCDANLLDGWGGFNIDGVAYRNDDSIDGPDDYYLLIDDGSCSNGGSFMFNHDDFAGNWLENGKCICFDLNAFHIASGTITGSSSLRIGNGVDNCSSSITATFVLDDPIDVSDGWVNICAPIDLSEAGDLPGNDIGHWVINTGSAADWDALIQNVQSLIFYVDVGSGDERWGLDNICFEECIDCEEVTDADFAVTQTCSSEGVTISVDGFNLYDDFGATHEWYIVSSPNQGAGPYTPVTSTTTTGPGPHVLATGLSDTLYYTVFHKVITEDCGEICYSREVWCTDFRGSGRAAEVDCCLIFEHWPNGPGEPIDFTAEFNHEITLDNIINAVPLYEYENNSSVVHEWYLYSRDELNSGDFTFITMQTGVDFSWGTAENGVYYFLLHKVISDCGEVCYMRAIYKSRSPEGTREECEICGPIDCSFIDDPNPECETQQPLNVQFVEGVLSWDAVPGAIGYIVENATVWPIDCRCDAPSSILPFQTTETSTPIAMGPGVCFVLQVRAICADGSTSLPSDLICVGGNKLKKVVANITPNPTQGDMTFNVETDRASSVTIEVYNFYGEMVRTFATRTVENEKTSISWEGPRLRKGVYFVKFITDEGTVTQRVIVH